MYHPGTLPTGLEDRFGRRFLYLRLSITDRCNLACTYCRTSLYNPKSSLEGSLSRSEIALLVETLASLGIEKIRITGGEPLLRSDLVDIIKDLKGISGVNKIALSTNGLLLSKLADSLHKAGVDSINISLDAFSKDTFQAYTGSDSLVRVLNSVEKCLTVGFSGVKINAVLLPHWDEKELQKVLDYVATRPVSFRFIELMRTNTNVDLFQAEHSKGEWIIKFLLAAGWNEIARLRTDGPARNFSHSGFQGSIGIIEPYADGFCDSCNRLRVTANGDLHLCLFGNNPISLRSLLKSPSQRDELIALVTNSLAFKEQSHKLLSHNSGVNDGFISIGG